MSLYQANSTSGEISTYKRAKQIIIENSIGGIPSATFIEELVATLPDGSIFLQSAGNLSSGNIDLSTSVPLINPADGSSMGSMTYGQIYAAIYSAYIALATARDANLE